MERIIKLNENDIIQVIANHFDVDRKNVTLTIDVSYEGYGSAEHKVYKASATVKEK